MTALLVFLMAFALDYLWALYIVWAALGRRLPAALASLGVAALGLTGTLAIVDETWLLAPYLAGIFLGTLVGVQPRDPE